MGDSKIEPRSKAEELAKKYRFVVGRGFGAAIDEALEWAAQQVEEWQDCDCGHGTTPGKHFYNTDSGHAMNCHFYVADLIRAGKS